MKPVVERRFEARPKPGLGAKRLMERAQDEVNKLLERKDAMLRHQRSSARREHMIDVAQRVYAAAVRAWILARTRPRNLRFQRRRMLDMGR